MSSLVRPSVLFLPIHSSFPTATLNFFFLERNESQTEIEKASQDLYASIATAKLVYS